MRAVVLPSAHRAIAAPGCTLEQGLEARKEELERIALDRVCGIGGRAGVADPEYMAGLRAAVSAALLYGIGGIAGREHPVPVELLAQARQAARHSVSLGTVMRRYFAGHALLGVALVEEAERTGWSTGAELTRAMHAEASLLDRVLVAVSEEYLLEVGERRLNPERRRVERVQRLLAGELADAGELEYEMDAWHLAANACGSGAAEALRHLATAFDSRLLLVRRDETTAWAWLGCSGKISAQRALRVAEAGWPKEALLGLGESAEGLRGWRMSHRQAAAALSVAQHGGDRIVRYADVSMLASALRDEVLSSSLREAYLAPLEEARDGGEMARQTLRAYLSANRNASSAAAALGVSRKTVSIRLRAAEDLIGRPLERCAAELETALRLGDLAQPGKLTSHIGPGNRAA